MLLRERLIVRQTALAHYSRQAFSRNLLPLDRRSAHRRLCSRSESPGTEPGRVGPDSAQGEPVVSEQSQTAVGQDVQSQTPGSILGANADPKKASWRKGFELAEQTARVVWSNAWTILAFFAICDGLVFVLHRFCHRLTNEVALRFLLEPSQAHALMTGSLWYLSNNPEIANFQTGYQWTVGVVFLLMFPVNIVLRTLACACSQLICSQRSESQSSHPGWIPKIRPVMSDARQAWSQVKPLITRLWQVDLLVAVRAIPLQAASILLIPLPWTLPRLLNLQLAGPVTLFQGEEGDEAIKKSSQLIAPARRAFAFPFVGVLLGSKLLAFLGRVVLMKLDPRITTEIPELPIAIYVLVAVSTVILHRIQDLLPFVAFRELTSPSKEALQPSPSQ